MVAVETVLVAGLLRVVHCAVLKSVGTRESGAIAKASRFWASYKFHLPDDQYHTPYNSPAAGLVEKATRVSRSS